MSSASLAPCWRACASVLHRLQSLSPAARRRLLQEQASPAPTRSPEWGPLRTSQLWLLTMGRTMHAQPQSNSLADLHTAALRLQDLSPGSKSHRSFHELLQPAQVPHAAAAEHAALQAALTDALQEAGAAVTSFLPPAAWLLVAAEEADLEAVRAAFPDVRLVRRPGSGPASRPSSSRWGHGCPSHHRLRPRQAWAGPPSPAVQVCVCASAFCNAGATEPWACASGAGAGSRAVPAGATARRRRGSGAGRRPGSWPCHSHRSRPGLCLLGGPLR
jgi:hypothetical protein